MNKNRLKISKQKVVVFSAFIFVATIFWFLDALKREYTTNILYPIEFYNFPEDVFNSSKYPKELSLTIKARGFDIIGKTNISKPIKVDVLKFSVKDKTNKKYILSLKKISADLFPKLNNIEVVNINPENIIFEAVRVLKKRVPIKANINLTLANLYMQSNNIIIKPDSIDVFGKKEDIREIKDVQTEHFAYKNLSDTLETIVKLKKINNINFSEERVLLTIPIEKYTENEINIPVNIINCPDTVKMLTFPKEVKVAYKIALSKYKVVNSADFIVTADYFDVSKNKDKILVKLTKGPKFIQSVKISPEYLEYIIKKVE